MNSDKAESENQFHYLFNNMQEGFAFHEVVFDESGKPSDYRYIDINPAFERLTGLSREVVIGKTVRELLPQIDEEWIETFCRVGTTGEPAELENYVHELGRYYRARAYSPEMNRFVVVFEDVTEQRKALRELQKSEEQLRVLSEASRAGILMVDLSGNIIMANRRMAEMFGLTMGELLQSKYPDLVHPDQRGVGDERMRKLIAREIDYVSNERHFIRKDGSDFWGFLSGRRHEDADGNFVSLVGHISDITELKLVEEAFRTSEEKFRSLFENAKDGIIILADDFTLLEVNSSFAAMHGYTVEEMRSMSLGDLDTPETRELVPERMQRLMAGEMLTFEVEHFCKDKRRVPFEISASLVNINGKNRILGFNRDVSDRKKAEQERRALEQQMLHAQKLESMGVLAGGIAHDFNNILTSIVGNADLALMRINKESPARENLHRIEQAAARAADLAKQMLAYSGRGKFVVEQIDLNRLLEEMLHILEVSISKKAVLCVNPHHPLPSVEADATQMRQIVMNLVINASEAIGDKSGVIAITTGCMDCNRSYLKDVWLDENISEGLYVYLEVADTGCGMDKETMVKLFDPFFTTKFTGRGLGMAAVLGIVRGHKGAIKVYSEPNRGTSFKILLPASGKPAELFDLDSQQHGGWIGTGTVLLVDDEESVRGIGTEMLKELGLDVITAEDGREALERYRERPDITLVVLDLTMPHLDGEQCFRELRQLNPTVKIIMSSGYNEQEVTQRFVGKGLSGFIQKPYTLSALREVIQAL